jgi:hypothetical protein
MAMNTLRINAVRHSVRDQCANAHFRDRGTLLFVHNTRVSPLTISAGLASAQYVKRTRAPAARGACVQCFEPRKPQSEFSGEDHQTPFMRAQLLAP